MLGVECSPAVLLFIRSFVIFYPSMPHPFKTLIPPEGETRTFFEKLSSADLAQKHWLKCVFHPSKSGKLKSLLTNDRSNPAFVLTVPPRDVIEA